MRAAVRIVASAAEDEQILLITIGGQLIVVLPVAHHLVLDACRDTAVVTNSVVGEILKVGICRANAVIEAALETDRPVVVVDKCSSLSEGIDISENIALKGSLGCAIF